VVIHVTFVLNRVSGTSVVSPECSSGLSRLDDRNFCVVNYSVRGIVQYQTRMDTKCSDVRTQGLLCIYRFRHSSSRALTEFTSSFPQYCVSPGESTIAANEGSQPIWTSVILVRLLRFRGVRATGLRLQPIGYMSSSYSSFRNGHRLPIPKAGAFAAIRHSVSSDAYSLVRRRPVLRAFPIACATLVLSTPLECFAFRKQSI